MLKIGYRREGCGPTTTQKQKTPLRLHNIGEFCCEEHELNYEYSMSDFGQMRSQIADYYHFICGVMVISSDPKLENDSAVAYGYFTKVLNVIRKIYYQRKELNN